MAGRLPAPFCSAPVVAIAAWLVPGSGYLLIGQWARGITIGLTILGLFLAGILIAGVRVMEVPGYTDHGERRQYEFIRVAGIPADPSTHTVGQAPVMGHGWIMQVAPLAELRDKPWSVPQLMTGPIAIATAVASVHTARPMPNEGDNKRNFEAGKQRLDTNGQLVSQSQQAPFYKGIGVLTHARINDIGSLYLSVAGLLNLMAIIDSAYRASRQPAPIEEDEA